MADADHSGDTSTQRSREGFLKYVNSVPLHWIPNKQTSSDNLSFGGEFSAMKKCCE